MNSSTLFKKPKTEGSVEKKCEKCGEMYISFCVGCSIENAKNDKKASNEHEEAMREAKYLEEVKNAIPPRFGGATFKNYRTGTPIMGEILEAVVKYSSMNTFKSGRSMIMAGNVGNGKTHLAVSVLKNRLWHGQTVKFITMEGMISNVRDCWTSYERSEVKEKKLYTDVDWLVIDEVGKQKGSENELQIIFSILNERYNQIKPTIMISNNTLEEFTQYIGSTIMDRLKEDDGLVINFDWKSFRGRK